MFFTKNCANCGKEFTKMGCAPGQCGLIGRMLGGLTCFLLFGGTSKYCPSCRETLKEQGEKVDKSFQFRLIWFLVVVGILCLLSFAA